MIRIPIACLLVLASMSVRAQQVEVLSWDTHTSMLNIVDVVETDSGNVWAATTGGVFLYTPSTGETTEYRNINALLDVNATALAWDSTQQALFVGTFSGYIEVFRDGEWTHITDINAKEAEFASVAIRDIIFLDSIALIGGDFGLALLDTKREVFLSTVTVFGEKTAPEVTAMHVFKDRLYVTTSLGVVFAELNETFWLNPRNPDIWQPVPIKDYPDLTRLQSFTVHNEELYVAGDTIVARLNELDTLEVSRTWNQGIQNVLSIGDRLYYTSPQNTISYSGHYFKQVPGSARSIQKLAFLPSLNPNEPVMLTRAGGILQIPKEPGDTLTIAPPTPIDNRFAGVGATEDGSIWTASNKVSGSGFSRFVDGEWTNFSTFLDPEVLSNDCYTLDVSRNGTVWVGTWGRGTAMLSPSDNYQELRYFNYNNSCMQPFQDGSDFTLGGSVSEGYFGTHVLLNVDTDALVLVDNNDNCSNLYPPFSLGELMYSVATRDLSGTVFVGGTEGQGILYWNGRNTVSEADDVWGRLTSSNSILGDNSQTTLVSDKDGALWIGTTDQLYVLANPGAVLTNSSLFMREVSALQGQSIVDIAVDPQNNKWVATKEGVFVLDPDGIEIINEYNTDNSLLVSNDILSIGFDAFNGRCLIGTNEGLSVAHTTSLTPNESFSNLRCYPQPFTPEQHDYVVVEGLAGESSVHIASIDGTVVRVLDAGDSQKVVWDGTNQRGELVPTGVYYIGVGSETQDSSSVLKLAVVRK